MYINEVVRYVKSNLEKMIGSEDVHAHFTRQKSDFLVQYCRTALFKNSSVNMGIKLYNKLPNEIKKLERYRFKKKTQALLTTTDILFIGRIFVLLMPCDGHSMVYVLLVQYFYHSITENTI
jgi:hypothetical protein